MASHDVRSGSASTPTGAYREPAAASASAFVVIVTGTVRRGSWPIVAEAILLDRPLSRSQACSAVSAPPLLPRHRTASSLAHASQTPK